MPGNDRITRAMTKRLCKCLVFLILLAFVLPWTAPKAATVSTGLTPLWDAPQRSRAVGRCAPLADPAARFGVVAGRGL
jgi:hypothetical protein